jgi:hypothetical protein
MSEKIQCCAMTVATKKEESRQCKKNAVNGGTMCAIHLKKNAADVESTGSTSDPETTGGGAPKTPTKPKKEPKVPGAPSRKAKKKIDPETGDTVIATPPTSEGEEEVPAMALPTGGGGGSDANAFAEPPKKGKGRPKGVPNAPKKGKKVEEPTVEEEA